MIKCWRNTENKNQIDFVINNSSRPIIFESFSNFEIEQQNLVFMMLFPWTWGLVKSGNNKSLFYLFLLLLDILYKSICLYNTLYYFLYTIQSNTISWYFSKICKKSVWYFLLFFVCFFLGFFFCANQFIDLLWRNKYCWYFLF